MSYQESTQESDPSQIDYKSLPSYTDEELYSKIMENVNKDLDNLFPESINSFQINTNDFKKYETIKSLNKIKDLYIKKINEDSNTIKNLLKDVKEKIPMFIIYKTILIQVFGNIFIQKMTLFLIMHALILFMNQKPQV